MPFGYTITITKFAVDRIIMRLNVRTPNGFKSIAEFRLAEPSLTNRISAVRKCIEILEMIKEKYELPQIGEKKSREVKSIKDLF